MLNVSVTFDGTFIGSKLFGFTDLQKAVKHIENCVAAFTESVSPATVIDFVVVDTEDFTVALHEQYRFVDGKPECTVITDGTGRI